MKRLAFAVVLGLASIALAQTLQQPQVRQPLPVSVPGEVRVTSPDGGTLAVDVPGSIRVQGSADGGPLTVAVPSAIRVEGSVDGGPLTVFVPEAVRVVGPTFGEVAIFGTVNLSNASLGALGTATCIHGVPRYVTVGTTPVVVPADLPDGGSGALAGRTRLLTVNVDSTRKLSCLPESLDASVPDCTNVGLELQPSGGNNTFEVDNRTRVRCVACTAGGVKNLNYMETACVPP